MGLKRCVLWVGLAGFIVLAGVGGYFHFRAKPHNSILVLRPYAIGPNWAFDDAAAGLKREALIAGVPEILNELSKSIPKAREGFLLTFSAEEFPTAQLKLTRVRLENGGAWYRTDTPGFPVLEGWLCPAIFKYFAAPPEHLYVRADAG